MKINFLPLSLMALVIACTPLASIGQTLPPIYDKTPVNLSPVKLIAEYPAGTFLENIAIDAKGNLFVNSHLDGKIYKIDKAGKRSEWATIDGTIAGISLNPDGSAVVSGWIKGKEPAVFKVSPSGKNEVLTRLPDGQFPNGVVRLASNRFLVADSYKGVIWDIDAARKTSQVWLEHEFLSRANTANPTPAVNGIKLFGGALYASNTARQLLIKIPLNGGKAGIPVVLQKDIGLDDFDFDKQGVLYGSTHVYNNVVRVEPSGQVSILAGVEQGMAGSTAVAVQPGKGALAVYVVTNGGITIPPPGGVQPGKVLRIDVPTKTSKP
jgi:hypothetical protein